MTSDSEIRKLCEEVEAEIEAGFGCDDEKAEKLISLLREKLEAKRQMKELIEHLEQYARHSQNCSVNGTGLHCTCGFDD